MVQIEREEPALQGFTFRNIWALDQPPLVQSTISGNVAGVLFDNVKYGQTRVTTDADVPLVVSGGAEAVHYSGPVLNPNQGPVAAFTIDPPFFAPGETVTFTAEPSRKARYTWLFGDGTTTQGRIVRHRFPDADGTELDGVPSGAGRFRVLLHVEDEKNLQDWAAQGVVAVSRWRDAAEIAGPTLPGLAFQIYPGMWTQLPDLSAEQAVFTDEAPNLQASARGFTRYAAAWDGYIDIPADGGYTFHLLSRDGARLVIDGVELAKTGPPFAQVCGSPGNAMRYDRGSLGLRAGKHALHVEGLHSASEGAPRLLWEGPSLPLIEVPPSVYSHPRQDSVTR